MSNTKKVCQLVMLISVAGCTAHPSKNQGADRVIADAPDVQCRSEQPTGSLISKTVCTTKAQRDAQQASSRDLQRAVQQQPGTGNK
jgi:hypothetical protein